MAGPAGPVLFILGCGVSLAMCVWIVRRSRRLLREARQTAATLSMRLGEVVFPVTVQVKVVVPPQTTRSDPVTGRPCVWWSTTREAPSQQRAGEWDTCGGEQSSAAFRVADDSGSGWVVPAGALVDLPAGLFESPGRLRHRVRRIVPGDVLWLHGPALRCVPPWASPDAAPEVMIRGDDFARVEIADHPVGRHAPEVRRRAVAGFVLSGIAAVWAVLAIALELWVCLG
jgi:hypothetical protein